MWFVCWRKNPMLDKLKNLGPKEKFLIGVILAMILLPVIGSFVIIPALRRYDILDAGISERSSLLEDNRSRINRKQNTQQQYDAIRGRLAKATLATEDIAALKGSIDELAELTGLTYASMSHQEPVPISEFCDEYVVNVGNFRTEMQNLLKFVRELHSTPGMMRVVGLTIKPIKGEAKVTGSITISKVMITDPESKVKVESEEAVAEEGEK
jgi:hypothetical protein